jgi:hypothetical protein
MDGGATDIRGLSEKETAARLKAEGPNTLPQADRRTFIRIVLEVLREPMFALLLGAAVIYLILGDLKEAVVLGIFACTSVLIAVVQESRTERVLESLRDLTSPRALVIRDGVEKRIAGAEVVRGDLVVLAEGDRVPADATVLAAHDLQCDESLLTGEAVPVRKIVSPGAPPARPGGDDLPYVYSGSLVVRGHGRAEVTATGARSEIGKIGLAITRIDTEPPRLRAQTRRLVRDFAAVSLASIAPRSGQCFEAVAGDDERLSLGSFGACEQLDDPGRDIDRGRWPSHAPNEIGLGYAEVAGIARDRILAEIGVRHDARRQGHEVQADPEPIRFLLTVVRDEHLRALGAGISSRNRRPGNSGGTCDQDNRAALGQRPRQCRLAEVECDLDVRLPVDGELLPALLVEWRSRRKGTCAQHQDVGLEHVEHLCRGTFIGCIERQNFGAGDLLSQLPERSLLPRHHEHLRAVADRRLDNPPSDAAAAADHDNFLACQ